MALPRPPRPRSLPLVGQALAFQRDPLALFTSLARTYGDVAGFQLGPLPACLINHPDDVHRILVDEARTFPKPRFLHMIAGKFLGNGVVTSEGEDWRRQRKLIQPAFHQQRLAGYAATMVEFASRLGDSWQPGQPFDLDRAMRGLTMEIVAKTLFNADAGAQAERVYQAAESFQEMLAKVNPLLPAWLPTAHNRREAAAVRTLDEIVLGFIAEHRAAGSDAGDMLSMLLRAQDEQGGAMSDRQVRDEAVTLFMAGHETTSSVLTWACYILATQPDVAATLRAELDTVLDGRAPTVADPPRLTYTDWFVKEVLRLYPAAWQTQRAAGAEVAFGDYRVKKGTTIFISPYLMQRDPRWWERPEEFRPERFSPANKASLRPHAYWPFGAGPRMCIGQQFATMESILIIATLAQRFEFALAPGARVGVKGAATLGTVAGMPMVVRQRGPSPEESAV
jgi:cytochrome P450